MEQNNSKLWKIPIYEELFRNQIGIKMLPKCGVIVIVKTSGTTLVVIHGESFNIYLWLQG
ncbi:hypothetical protein ACJDU8_06265 [Clostridium sp. WILCCON 0269]|uniref:Uncharacterized protein n=1 Tax=Candidatus Clostridium eludens TaxID=3381663 RepID=A0ABW8SGR5_9CLOT